MVSVDLAVLFHPHGYVASATRRPIFTSPAYEIGYKLCSGESGIRSDIMINDPS